jgi:aryl-alcohol dehydrogenase-like predicted oxidoreductase
MGRTEMEISPIGLGVMQFSGGTGLFGLMFLDLSQAQMNAIIRAALDAGVNWFDTAEIYGFGHSEQALAEGLRANDQGDRDVVVASKWFPFLRTAANIRKTIQDRKHHLRGYTIDLYYIHQPYGLSSVQAEMEAMAELVQEGHIRAVGVSNFSAERMARAYDVLQERGLPLVANQVEYSLLNREIEQNGVLNRARELGITIVAYSPLAKGILSAKYHRDPDLMGQKSLFSRFGLGRDIERSRPVVGALEEIAAAHDVTPAQVALNWLIHFHGEAVVAIPGATSVAQSQQNAGAMHFELSQAEMDRLNELTLGFI